MFDAVLLDFNGVLVDDEHLHLACFNAVLAPLGVHVSSAEYEARYIGFDDRGAFEAMLRDAALAPPDGGITELIAQKSVRYAELAREQLRIFDGAATLVREAAALAPVAIVSGALRAEIEGALALMDVRACVSTIVSAEDVERCKPDPAGYLMACARLGLKPSSQQRYRAVAVEDTVAGVLAARAAGVDAIGVVNGAPEGQALRLAEAGAGLVVERTARVDGALLARLASASEALVRR